MRRDPEVEALRERISELEERVAVNRRDRALWAAANSRERQRLHQIIRDYEQRLGIPEFASMVSNQDSERES